MDESLASSNPSLGLSFSISQKPVTASSDDEDRPEKDTSQRQKDIEPPLISIELKRLIGYPPSSQDVVDSIQSQLVEAMWSRYREENGAGEVDDGVEEDGAHEEKERDSTRTSSIKKYPRVPPDFDSQIQELLDAQIARCGRPSITETDVTADAADASNLEYLILSYPPKIRNPLAALSTDNINSLLDTAQAWKEIHQLAKVYLPLPPPSLEDIDRGRPANTSPTAFLQQLTKHLLNTSRTLTWKYAMANELKSVLKQELMWKQHQQWTARERQAKLDNLYGVRETLVHQTELAKQDLQRLYQIRDKKVSHELMMQYHKLEQEERQQAGGVLDLGLSDLDLAKEFQLLGMTSRQDEYEDFEEEVWDEASLGAGSYDEDYSSYDGSTTESGDIENDDSIGNDASGIDGSSAVNDAIPTEIKIGESANSDHDRTDPISSSVQARSHEDQGRSLTLPFQRRKERRKRAKERKRKERMKVEHEARREKLKAVKEQLENQHTTRELILAQTMLNALKKKVEHVDELLESLQDEVWAAEEEQEEEEQASEQSAGNVGTEKPSFSLLDQVLAMILGALPTNPTMTRQEQYRFTRSEHDAIVKGWEDYFGRLPPAVDATSTHKEGGRDAPSALGKTTRIPQTPQEQRKALGILDNDDAEWDADD
jgi:hypothetical protein